MYWSHLDKKLQLHYIGQFTNAKTGKKTFLLFLRLRTCGGSICTHENTDCQLAASSVISETRQAAAILWHWRTKHTFVYNKAKEKQIDKRTFLAENAFQLSPNTAIELHKMKNRDYYRFLINKDKDTPRKGTRPTSGTPSSRHLFNRVKNVWKNNKLKEFYFKLLHRMVVTRKGLFFYGMESNYQEPD